jgi:hypothetical protein
VSQDDMAKLNGRLTSHGWRLIFIKNSQHPMKTFETSLLKLSPGRFFAQKVKEAVFVEQNCQHPPTHEDVIFLSNQMSRSYREARIVSWESELPQFQLPRGKILVPPEPPRRATFLGFQLKYQDDPDIEPLPAHTFVNSYIATRYMRYETGESALSINQSEPFLVQEQREFCERVQLYTNAPDARHFEFPNTNFMISPKWVSTRLVIHDLTKDESRTQIRCPWYKDHSHWETPLDQLSLFYVLEKMDIERRLVQKELDDAERVVANEMTKLKGGVSDAFEWLPLKATGSSNSTAVRYSPYQDEVKPLPCEIEYVTDRRDQLTLSTKIGSISISNISDPLLFVRIIADDIVLLKTKHLDYGKILL